MYGPAPERITGEKQSIRVAMMQLSMYHTRLCTEWCAKKQIDIASRRKADIGVLPALFCFEQGEVAKDVVSAAKYSMEIMKLLSEAAKAGSIRVAASLVEEEGAKYYHTAYLYGPDGVVEHKYRKAHLNRAERAWATQGEELCPVWETPLGRLAFMIDDEVWIPEVSRALALNGVETVLHPCDWDRQEAPNMAAVERTSENRTHLVSVARLDNMAKVGSQVVFAGEFIGGEPIALMRYPMAQWMRYGVEEQMVVTLERREANCKMMGFCLDVLAHRFPQCYGQMGPQ